MFLEISVLGRYKDILEISILLNIKKIRIFAMYTRISVVKKLRKKKKKKDYFMNCAKKLLGFHIKYVRILCYNLFDDNVKTFLEISILW